MVLGKTEDRLKILSEDEFKSYRIERMDEGVFMIDSKRMVFCNKSARSIEKLELNHKELRWLMGASNT